MGPHTAGTLLLVLAPDPRWGVAIKGEFQRWFFGSLLLTVLRSTSIRKCLMIRINIVLRNKLGSVLEFVSGYFPRIKGKNLLVIMNIGRYSRILKRTLKTFRCHCQCRDIGQAPRALIDSRFTTWLQKSFVSCEELPKVLKGDLQGRYLISPLLPLVVTCKFWAPYAHSYTIRDKEIGPKAYKSYIIQVFRKYF